MKKGGSGAVTLNNTISLRGAVFVKSTRMTSNRVTANYYQKAFIEDLKAIISTNIKNSAYGTDMELDFTVYPPRYRNGRPEISIFYLKPVMVVVPHIQFVSCKLSCDDCKASLKPIGWKIVGCQYGLNSKIKFFRNKH